MIISPEVTATTRPVTHERQLIAWHQAGATPAEHARLRAGCELLLANKSSYSPLKFAEKDGLAVLMAELEAFQWRPIFTSITTAVIGEQEEGERGEVAPQGKSTLGHKTEEEGITALKRAQQSLTFLGAGGQLCLQSALHENLHTLATEMYTRYDEIVSVCRVLNQIPLCTGIHPLISAEQMPKVPSPVYTVLSDYLNRTAPQLDVVLKRGASQRFSCTYESENDMVEKFRLAISLQPLLAACLASSPIFEGKAADALSVRTKLKTHDNRVFSLLMKEVFEPDFDFEAYVQWVMSVPIPFVRNESECLASAPLCWKEWIKHDVATTQPQTQKEDSATTANQQNNPPTEGENQAEKAHVDVDFVFETNESSAANSSQKPIEHQRLSEDIVEKGRKHNLPETPDRSLDVEEAAARSRLNQLTPTLQNWIDHIAALPVPVRLSRMIEIESGDMGHPELVLAQAAFWKALLLDPMARMQAWEIIEDWTSSDRERLYRESPEKGMDIVVKDRSVREIMSELLDIAEQSLTRTPVASGDGLYDDESQYLLPLRILRAGNLTQAEEALRYFYDDWGGDAKKVIRHFHMGDIP